MSKKKHKAFYWLFKILGVIVSCALPIWAICEKFPIWTLSYGKTHSIGMGGILALIVMLIIFRKAVFNFFAEKLKLKHAPPLAVWLVLLIISYVLVYISNVMRDLTIVLWMGLIGSAIGTLLTFIAENHFKKEKDEDGNNG